MRGTPGGRFTANVPAASLQLHCPADRAAAGPGGRRSPNYSFGAR